MSDRDECLGGPTRPNGNCTNPGPDGLPVQCVGDWARDKHDYLRRYIDATRGPRSKYIPRGPKRGGAAFIDLFAGPGRCRIRASGEIMDGSPLIALAHAGAPFTDVIFCELDAENVDALRARTSNATARVEIVLGDCNARIDEVVARVPEYGLNVALLDPFGPSELKWATIEKLGRLRRMDLVIHFPTGPIKRNFKRARFDQTLDELVGETGWREVVHDEEDVVKLAERLRSQLVRLGYENEHVRSMPVTNSKKVILYHLVFASKHRRGSAIWKSVTQIDARGQRGLRFD